MDYQFDIGNLSVKKQSVLRIFQLSDKFAVLTSPDLTEHISRAHLPTTGDLKVRVRVIVQHNLNPVQI